MNDETNTWSAKVAAANKETQVLQDVQQSIRGGLRTEFLSRGIRPEIQEKLSITFPAGDKPAIRIHLVDGDANNYLRGGVIDADKSLHTVTIAEKTENPVFEAMKKKHGVTIKNGGGYYGRNDITITAGTLEGLMAVVGSFISNDFVRKRVLDSAKPKEVGNPS